MSFKAIIRKLTGKGGAFNNAKTTKEVCQLNTLAWAARVSVYDID